MASRNDLAQRCEGAGSQKIQNESLCVSASLRENAIIQDFQRDVYCLFGLPVDNITMEGTKAWLREKAGQEGNVVLSTININWVVQSLADPEFRDAILNSDLITLDGKPLLWLAKLLGYPIKEVVPGSSLIQELHRDRDSEKPLTIFFFGGEEGTAAKAMEQVNNNPGGLRAVGYLNPGFGTVEEMSSQSIITAINQAKPDILLVALGAGKGTRWIEYNRHRLNAKIISHLGATINFLAGTVQRAPEGVRKIGMEWVWRILKEPKLFPRYARDGLVMLNVLIRHFPLWLRYFASQRNFNGKKEDPDVQHQENEQEITLSFGSNLPASSPVRELLSKCARSGKDLTLDFRRTEHVNGAFMGLLLLLSNNQKRSGRKLTLHNVHGGLSRMVHLLCIQAELKGQEN